MLCIAYVAGLAEFGALSTVLAGQDWPAGAQAWFLLLLPLLGCYSVARRALASRAVLWLSVDSSLPALRRATASRQAVVRSG